MLNRRQVCRENDISTTSRERHFDNISRTTFRQRHERDKKVYRTHSLRTLKKWTRTFSLSIHIGLVIRKFLVLFDSLIS